ncbi:cytochrome P450 [Streptomyces sp. B1866]|uniref:cytochrome P450 n=1 Tax=Streptomyces sp. B1866 TaxID=3075431 RepID=UPI0028910E06|nr:cytochrome P450 [Streptomyces sp. B1866]MDT3395907.1 cytochrome P450 [Streptomyces sp. B1866]
MTETASPTPSPAPASAGRPALATLFDVRHRADPYPVYREWRASEPISQPQKGLFVLTRHEDCAAVLRDPRFGHTEPDQTGPLREASAVRRDPLVGDDGRPVRSFLGLNPPDHTRLRGLVSKAFTPRMVARLAPRVEQVTAELLDAALARGGPVDLIDALASPLPVIVISELLDVPLADRDRFTGWSHAMARGLDPDFLLPAGLRDQQLRARGEFAEYFRELAARRRREPGEDLLSALVSVHDQGDTLTELELLTTCTLLLIAGHETTVNLIGNGTLALLRDPAQLDLLRAEPDLAERAVEELLRYDSPVQFTTRTALKDAEVGGVPVPKGAYALVVIGAAGRDPAAHDDPERLDIRREPSRHLAFGHGVHFCLGAPLARLEGRIALRELVARAPGLRLAGEPAWKDNLVLRGLARLPVELR